VIVLNVSDVLESMLQNWSQGQRCKWWWFSTLCGHSLELVKLNDILCVNKSDEHILKNLRKVSLKGFREELRFYNSVPSPSSGLEGH